jgi:hypothetical protein
MQGWIEMAKGTSRGQTWDEIGKAIGEKMENECKGGKCKPWEMKGAGCGGGSGAIYGLGFLGALVYYISTATSVWAGIIGIVKALLWPAFLV